MATADTARERHLRSRTPVVPHTPLGWCGVGLLLLTAVSPAFVWAALTPLIKHADPNAMIRTAMTIAIALPSIVVGIVALSRREARSVLLVVMFAIVAIEICWAIFWVVSFATL